MDEQGSNTAMRPIADLGTLSMEQFSDYCADLWERVEAGDLSIDQASDLMFGPEPTITYTRWSA